MKRIAMAELVMLLACIPALVAEKPALAIQKKNADSAGTTPAPFELTRGDRVVLLGSTVVEREQRYGYWETALAIRWADQDVTFRNLGWSGDTVWGEARAGFDTAREGYQRLLEETRAVKPTIILICYGTNESFAGKAGLVPFRAQLSRLLDDLQQTRARLVLLAPPGFEKATWPAGNFEDRQRGLALYTEAVRQVAAQRRLRFAGEFCQHYRPPVPITDDGMHLTPYGYWKTAAGLLQALGVSSAKDPSHQLPRSDRKEIFNRAEKLRLAIVEKNRLYFHRWRPENETYLFGFRKYEQGKNAREIPEFDPLVAAQEKEIARLRQQIPPSYLFLPEEAER
jgi:lysophospholipase L1-like esterase